MDNACLSLPGPLGRYDRNGPNPRNISGIGRQEPCLRVADSNHYNQAQAGVSCWVWSTALSKILFTAIRKQQKKQTYLQDLIVSPAEAR